MYPQVVQVLPKEDYTVYVYFEDGKIVNYDVSPLLSKEIFSPLKELKVFIETCTVMNDTLAWDIEGNRDVTKSIDIAPDTLYLLEAVSDIGEN